jgi:hypothetical protein
VILVALHACVALGAGMTIGFVARNAEQLLVSPRYACAYLGVPSAFLVLSLAALFLRRLRVDLALVVVPAGIAFWAAEAWLAATQDSANNTGKRIEMAAVAAAGGGRAMDRRVQTTVLAELRAAGVQAYPTFSPTTFLLADHGKGEGEWRPPMSSAGRAVLPLGGVPRARSVYCNEGGEWLVFDADRHGFNNPDAAWDEPRRRLAILGDSFAQGACVPMGRAAPDILRARFPGTINLGVGGTGPLLQLAVLKEYGPRLAPEEVLWFFYEGNDLHVNLHLERQFAFLRRYLEPSFSQGLESLAPEVSAFLRAYIDERMDRAIERDTAPVVRRTSVVDMLKLTRLRESIGLTSCPVASQDFALLARIYAEARRSTEAWGGRLTVVYLPSSEGECDLFDPTVARDNWLRRGVRDAAAAAGVPLLDFGARIAARADVPSLFYYPGSHFNEKGYALLAEVVAQSLDQGRSR